MPPFLSLLKLQHRSIRMAWALEIFQINSPILHRPSAFPLTRRPSSKRSSGVVSIPQIQEFSSNASFHRPLEGFLRRYPTVVNLLTSHGFGPSLGTQSGLSMLDFRHLSRRFFCFFFFRMPLNIGILSSSTKTSPDGVVIVSCGISSPFVSRDAVSSCTSVEVVDSVSPDCCDSSSMTSLFRCESTFLNALVPLRQARRNKCRGDRRTNSIFTALLGNSFGAALIRRHILSRTLGSARTYIFDALLTPSR